MPRTTRNALGLAAAAALFAPTFAHAAEEGTVKILAPWESAGQVYRIGPSELLFTGAADGIMYIESGEGDLDTAAFECPGTREISLESGDSTGHGRCIITTTSGDQVFAMYRCKGTVGGCEGKFTLTGGTGKFEGITGEGMLIVRSALAKIATHAASGTTVSGAAGLAVWPSLTYRIP